MTENKRTIPFSPPDISNLEITEVVDALKSGWITTGPRTKQFEKEIADVYKRQMLKDLVISVENQQFDVITDMIVKIENSYGRIGNSQDVDFRVISCLLYTSLSEPEV